MLYSLLYTNSLYPTSSLYEIQAVLTLSRKTTVMGSIGTMPISKVTAYSASTPSAGAGGVGSMIGSSSTPNSTSTASCNQTSGSNTVVTKKNMLAMKRVLTIAHQLGNNLCDSWAIVLDTLDVINTTLADPSSIVVDNESTDIRKIIHLRKLMCIALSSSKDELQVLDSAMTSIFSTSHYLADTGVVYLFKELEKQYASLTFPSKNQVSFPPVSSAGGFQRIYLYLFRRLLHPLSCLRYTKDNRAGPSKSTSHSLVLD